MIAAVSAGAMQDSQWVRNWGIAIAAGVYVLKTVFGALKHFDRR